MTFVDDNGVPWVVQKCLYRCHHMMLLLTFFDGRSMRLCAETACENIGLEQIDLTPMQRLEVEKWCEQNWEALRDAPHKKEKAMAIQFKDKEILEVEFDEIRVRSHETGRVEVTFLSMGKHLHTTTRELKEGDTLCMPVNGVIEFVARKL